MRCIGLCLNFSSLTPCLFPPLFAFNLSTVIRLAPFLSHNINAICSWLVKLFSTFFRNFLFPCLFSLLFLLLLLFSPIISSIFDPAIFFLLLQIFASFFSSNSFSYLLHCFKLYSSFPRSLAVLNLSLSSLALPFNFYLIFSPFPLFSSKIFYFLFLPLLPPSSPLPLLSTPLPFHRPIKISPYSYPNYTNVMISCHFSPFLLFMLFIPLLSFLHFQLSDLFLFFISLLCLFSNLHIPPYFVVSTYFYWFIIFAQFEFITMLLLFLFSVFPSFLFLLLLPPSSPLPFPFTSMLWFPQFSLSFFLGAVLPAPALYPCLLFMAGCWERYWKNTITNKNEQYRVIFQTFFDEIYYREVVVFQS